MSKPEDTDIHCPDGIIFGSVAKIILEHRSLRAIISLCRNMEETQDKLRLPHHVISIQSFDLTFAYHVNRFNAIKSSPRRIETLEAL